MVAGQRVVAAVLHQEEVVVVARNLAEVEGVVVPPREVEEGEGGTSLEAEAVGCHRRSFRSLPSRTCQGEHPFPERQGTCSWGLSMQRGQTEEAHSRDLQVHEEPRQIGGHLVAKDEQTLPSFLVRHPVHPAAMEGERHRNRTGQWAHRVEDLCRRGVAMGRALR